MLTFQKPFFIHLLNHFFLFLAKGCPRNQLDKPLRFCKVGCRNLLHQSPNLARLTLTGLPGRRTPRLWDHPIRSTTN